MSNGRIQPFWDSSNADAFSTCKLAIKLGPDGFPVTYSLQTVDPNGWVTKQDHVYKIKPITDTGKLHTITTFGGEPTANDSQEMAVGDNLRELLSDVPPSVRIRHHGRADQHMDRRNAGSTRS